MTEKRLPQVGEIWWTRDKELATCLSINNLESQPLVVKNHGCVRYHNLNGNYWPSNRESFCDLLHIHTDATGKVINPTFPGDDMKKQTQAPVDPFTIDWPRSAFKVGEMYVLKPNKKEDANHCLDWSQPAIFHIDDGSLCPEFIDHKGNMDYEDLELLAPLSEVEKYRAAIAGQKPPKPDPITQALEASRERVKDLEALQELTAKARANKAEAKELATKIKGLKEKVGMK